MQPMGNMTAWRQGLGRPHVICVMVPAAILSGVGGAAYASANLVLNDGFEQDSLTPSGSGYSSFEIGSYSYNSTSYTGAVVDWTINSSDYNLVFTTGSATALSSYGPLTLYDGATIGNSLAGGNFLVSDGDFNSGDIAQTISGLTIGAKTTLSFYWAAAQQTGFTGSTTEYWQASLGSATQDTATYNLAQGAFSGSMQVTMTFIPTSTSEVPSFLAVGTDSPPMLLLDGVTMPAPDSPKQIPAG
jgi:hypothetical protein